MAVHSYWVARVYLSVIHVDVLTIFVHAEDKFYYGVRIVTGSQQASSATARNVFFTLTGTNSRSEKISLGVS